jgi:hypothetical protein
MVGRKSYQFTQAAPMIHLPPLDSQWLCGYALGLLQLTGPAMRDNIEGTLEDFKARILTIRDSL